ncbi:BlaI family penicillinase repressor [Clostridium tetanomorphum]|uniref:BlaI/MecI/CopY family transcriptional regulator n=1 Tax=Clostridium tetanomorphum TaxID=1553 RepID=A0A923EEN6_CLOTT|nr:BlaI/MecI/CopY family transcriptional regulator [Clostridium tetanomorphum]KAJ49827.1 hypothetical protein CTM_21186 [Clostridium tetanomorphum DSM 665]MBC2399725.1 BlaI/MecI/CopY family transcriptional regulator [Clostridium tetanomorphum]MBP1865129.1 BlaI family penicillinase repressor [Clostridium tetanomorphum]NRS84732.1 BlaI family penicillinase repressor [Clostridium tetanomorphum]NRZ97948.1 BlaI family penicillinase repressor [Clostridium tetanomorphum]
MINISKISHSEWQIMNFIWNNSTCTANEVVEALSKTSNWKPKTIRTLINRLVNKGILGYEIDKKDKKTYHYFALISEKECKKEESKSFLKRVFNGSVNSMLVNFISENELSSEEIDELKSILDRKKKG